MPCKLYASRPVDAWKIRIVPSPQLAASKLKKMDCFSRCKKRHEDERVRTASLVWVWSFSVRGLAGDDPQGKRGQHRYKACSVALPRAHSAVRYSLDKSNYGSTTSRTRCVVVIKWPPRSTCFHDRSHARTHFPSGEKRVANTSEEFSLIVRPG